MTFQQLRAELDGRGFVPELVTLPNDPPHGPVAEGALRVIETPNGYEVQCVDYGRPRTVASAPDAQSVAESLLAFLDRPIPAALSMAPTEVTAIESRLAPFYPPLREQILTNEVGAILIQLPPGVLVDRIGAMDGWLLNPLNSSFESRSLPPTALREPSTVHQFVTEATVLVQASIVQPWFGQPGGAVRYTVADEPLTVRDLLVEGSLRQISVRVEPQRW